MIALLVVLHVVLVVIAGLSLRGSLSPKTKPSPDVAALVVRHNALVDQLRALQWSVAAHGGNEAANVVARDLHIEMALLRSEFARRSQKGAS